MTRREFLWGTAIAVKIAYATVVGWAYWEARRAYIRAGANR